MVEESFQYHAEPANEEVARRAWSDIQTCREVYNHALTQHYHPAPDYDKPSYTAMQIDLLHGLKAVESRHGISRLLSIHGFKTYTFQASSAPSPHSVEC